MRRASSSFKCEARAMFSFKAACRGSCAVATEGCAVEVECARAARSSGLARTSARSCFLGNMLVGILGNWGQRYIRFIL